MLCLDWWVLQATTLARMFIATVEWLYHLTRKRKATASVEQQYGESA
jgi:hypothetical protein